MGKSNSSLSAGIVDKQVSKTCARKGVGVQVPPEASRWLSTTVVHFIGIEEVEGSTPSASLSRRSDVQWLACRSSKPDVWVRPPRSASFREFVLGGQGVS